MVEGKRAAQDDRADDIVQIGHHDRRGQTQCRDPLGCEPFVAYPIACGSITHVMGHPVDLNGELCLRAIKVEDESAEWMLPAETDAGWLGPQDGP
jgi:hypothetical protein